MSRLDDRSASPSTRRRPTHLARTLWAAHPPLTALGLAMLPTLAACLIGLLVDGRVVTGAPVWLKPAKFAASIAVYALTLAWAAPHLATGGPRLTRRAGNVVAGTLTLEIVVIVAQAARGQTSHFNVATALDATLFGIMGTAILVQTLAAVALTIAAFRTRLADRAMGEAIRWGLAISIAGGAVGGLMTQPTTAQLTGIRAGTRPTVIGAHTVGAPDGGAGVPGVGWSSAHGDLRVGHFVGLHALQGLPLLAWRLGRRRRTSAARLPLVRIAAAAWLTIAAILVAQALRGVSVSSPDAATLAALGTVAAVTIASAAAALRRAGRVVRHTPRAVVA